MLPFAIPRVMFCVDDNYRCQTRPRRAGLALLKPAALQPFLTGDAIEDVFITTADPRALVADGTPVIQPRGCERLDVGISLGVLVSGGRSPKPLSCFAVLDFARGDVPANQGYLARSFPTHKVVATTMAPADVLDAELTLSLTVDGAERQQGSTASMIADVRSLIRTIGAHYTADEDWLLLTGSPAGRPADEGAGWLGPGATVRGQIGGIGSVSAEVVAESIAPEIPPSAATRILGTGGNYSDHMSEMAVKPQDTPSAFLKLPGAAIGPDEPLLLGLDDQYVDYEGEIALVIGQAARDLSTDDALSAIAGLTLANDISARNVAMPHAALGKGHRGFCPLGSAVVPTEELDLDDITIMVSVNGEQRQNGHTGSLIHSFAEIVSSYSRAVSLEPGDVILTGTPSGVGVGRRPPVFLRPGDEVIVSSPQLGVLRTPVARG